MHYLSTQMIRQKFLDFFASKGHMKVESSSLVPLNDPTLLFTNAGMNQFKEVFLGTDTRPYVRATSSQRCVRAGGKHNDLENVGFTARHHTFFEMLGNFSFGDYFKEDAIKFAYELLTDVFQLPQEKLLVTVHHTDDEAFNIWKDVIKMPESKIIRIKDKADGSSDNFWQMGDTGPCGPCTEIFYDHGPSIPGGIPGSPEEDGDRFIEIWNLVFMQFNRDEKGVLHPLPKPSVDTGMGLERLAAVLQGVHSNYEIDLFKKLIASAGQLTNTTDLNHNSLKVIADHIRSVSFLIADGVLPSNEGRGYVLRRIIRRAVRHGYKLGQKNAFFHRLVFDLVQEMGEAFPSLATKQAQIEAVILKEEQQFSKTLEHGLKLLENHLSKLENNKVLSGEIIFKLYDTYGFPVDLTNDIARELNLELDMTGFDACMKKQQESGRAENAFSTNKNVVLNLNQSVEFKGYFEHSTQSKVIALLQDGLEVQHIQFDPNQATQNYIIVLDKTPFYGESGGQVGDTGIFRDANKQVLFNVTETQKQGDKVILHFGHLIAGKISIGDEVSAQIDVAKRQDIKNNHSATHLLHKALRDLLGDQVEQKGSLVDDERLRFDFSYAQGLSAEQIAVLETRINAEIRENHLIDIQEMDIESAKNKGAMALFGEKYGDFVRVVQMGGYSIELCGGTHVQTTGEIGLFKIISETGIASGVRRIEAVTGKNALTFVRERQDILNQICEQLKSDPNKVLQKVSQLLSDLKLAEKTTSSLKMKLALSSAKTLVNEATVIGDVKVIIARMDDIEAKELKELAENLRDQIQGVVLLGSITEGKASFVAAVAKVHTSKIKAGEFVNIAANIVGGKGGGKPECAMAGGTNIDQFAQALTTAQQWVESTLKS